MRLLSYPISDISSGTEIPARSRVSRTPTAQRSLNATTAVTLAAWDSRFRVAAAPSSSNERLPSSR